MASTPPRARRASSLAVACALVLAGCATSGVSVPATISDAEWRALATPRTVPLDGAPAVTVGTIQLVGPVDLPEEGLEPGLVVAELVVAGLMRRADVRFVERRRFVAAVEAERNGSRPPAAPAAGVSPEVRLIASASWLSVTPTLTTAEVRLSSTTTGAVVASTRVAVDPTRDPVSVARTIVQGVLDALDELGPRPTWTDPLAATGGTTGAASVSAEAVLDFVAGLTAEERWRWEAARRGYQAAAADPAFHEASVLLARTARLRNGGTLGES